VQTDWWGLLKLAQEPKDRLIDTGRGSPNNAGVAKPEAVHRIKSYSAASGFVYQYHFVEVVPARRGSSFGNEYTYMVSRDRKTMFPVKIFVRRDAVDRWRRKTGRALTGTEEYAVAKMRLLQVFDEAEEVTASSPDLIVDESNLESLLTQLDI
jgi:hypothetical protein